MNVLLLCFMILSTAGCGGADPKTNNKEVQTPAGHDSQGDHKDGQTNAGDAPSDKPATISLISADLKGWQPIQFGGEGEVSVEEGILNLDMGTMTGLRYTDDLTKLFGDDLQNYEIELDAKRVEGLDIFLGLTFPVGKAGHVSLVLGGWGGVVNGISSLDGGNASENKTSTYKDGGYEPNQWYHVRIRVTDQKIECWLDDKQIVDVNRADYSKYDTHGMVQDSKPFGLFTYETWGAYKDLKVRRLK